MIRNICALLIIFFGVACASSAHALELSNPQPLLEPTVAKRGTTDQKASNGSSGDGKVIVYFINQEIFNAFIKNPSLEILQQKNKHTVICSYTRGEREGYIEQEVLTKRSLVADEIEKEHMRVKWLPVHDEFINFAGNLEAIANYLQQHGIDDQVKRSVLVDLSSSDVPLTMWIQTASSNYFLAFETDINNLEQTQLAYSFYTQEQYYTKYRVQPGMVVVNGVVLSDANARFGNSRVYLPLIPVMEKLGASIQWDKSQNAVLLTCNGSNYYYDIQRGVVFRKGETAPMMKNEWFALDGGLVDNDVVMNNINLKGFLDLMNANIKIDPDTLTVTIDTRGQRESSIHLTHKTRLPAVTAAIK